MSTGHTSVQFKNLTRGERIHMSTENNNAVNNEAGILPIPHKQRESWVNAAIVWAGCEFAISVIMTGSGIIANFSLKQFVFISLFGLLGITWIFDSINCHLGALTGRSSTVITRSSFGSLQSKYVISLIIMLNLIGWWAIQTSITGNALCTMFNIDYTSHKGMWAIMTIVAGILFALPPIFGYSSVKWVDYVAVPGGVLLCVAGFYLSIKGVGLDSLLNFQPEQKMLATEAISLIVGANVSQMVIMADYTRFCKPTIKNAAMVPVGVVIVGFMLFMMGAIMGVGKGTFDIVAIMKGLGFGWWGFLILWLAQWTSQLVCVYSMGLCLSNMFDAKNDFQRKAYTTIGSVIALIIALLGILDHFMDFLFLTGLMFPAVGAIMATDFFLISGKVWRDRLTWNWLATMAMAAGIAVGYYTQYIHPWGVPAIQSYFVAAALYYILTYAKAKYHPDDYSPALK